MTEQTITPQAEIASYTFDSELYHNSLTVWKNDRLLKDGIDYSLNQAGSSLYEIIFSEKLMVGDIAILQFWNIPQTGGSSVGQTTAVTTGVSDSIEGISTEIEEEETT